MEPPLCEHTIREAKTGDIVSLYGTPWRVIGFQNDPSALLERVGYEGTPVNERSHHSVILTSPHALSFKLLPKKNRAKDLVEAWWATRPQLTDRDSEALDFANYLITHNLINEKGAL